MNDCFVTELKGVVNNDNLVGIGEILFNVDAPAGTAIAARTLSFQFSGTTEQIPVKVVGDGFITNDNGDNLGKSTTISPAYTTVKFSTGTYKIKVGYKYILNTIQGGAGSKISVDAGQLHFSNMVTLYQVILTGEVKLNRLPNLFGAISPASDYYGSFDNLKDVEPAAVTAIAAIRLTGNAANLKNINSSQYICNFNASGTVESLTVARAARNVAGTVKLDLVSATLNGKKAPAMDMVYTAGGDCTIKITGTSTEVATYISGTWTYYGNYQ